MKKLIIVDDDPSIRDIFTLIFPGDAYEITTYTSSEPLINNSFVIPDLFIFDKQLSGVDGLDLCRFIKQQPATRDIPVIILSASPNIKILAEKAGADDVLEKPFRIAELRDRVKKQLMK